MVCGFAVLEAVESCVKFSSGDVGVEEFMSGWFTFILELNSCVGLGYVGLDDSVAVA